jgi:hypothetical protein
MKKKMKKRKNPKDAKFGITEILFQSGKALTLSSKTKTRQMMRTLLSETRKFQKI